MSTERKRKRPQKSESLTIRLDPKMRFALEFVARLRGQTITKVIERAVMEDAENAYVTDGGRNIKGNWSIYWDVNDGVRAIKLASDSDTHPSFEEDEMLDFIKVHWNYFSFDRKLLTLRRDNLDILWPEIENLIETWRNCKATNRKYCASLMRAMLVEAGLDEKSWAPSNMDDERHLVDPADASIPF
ncbi:hypothetical protein [Acetobacter fabarum]|uniref:hypothetical protein n=1 Tax=Acetobacter fabarum TaxID=483199 RepID=UPI00209CEB91|nr:hypothetical protein [Acetobacter fabarum]MCP1227955.1 hypothetical protein [Acetobacter fabarum]MCP1233451.1 hypothetical protein [Acetobacter fabarum]